MSDEPAVAGRGGRGLCFGLGFLLAAALVSAPGVVRSSRQHAAPTGPPVARAVTERPDSGDPRQPECWLGVVVPRQGVAVAAEAEGQLEQVLVRVGDLVEAGQPLAVLDVEALRHQLEIERAAHGRSAAEKHRRTLELARAERERDRRQQLADVLSREELERSEFDSRQAAADLRAAEAEISRVVARIRQLEGSLARAVIKAPFAGTIAHRYLDPGAVVAPGAPVVRLISADSKLRFAVPPESAGALELGTRLRVESAGVAQQVAVVEGRAPEIDVASQMVLLEAGLEPPGVPGTSGMPGSGMPGSGMPGSGMPGSGMLASGTVARLSSLESGAPCRPPAGGEGQPAGLSPGQR